MKKLILFAIPVMLFMAACNNKPQSGDTVASGTDTSNKTTNSVASTSGTGSTPAQVFIDATNKGQSGATVAAYTTAWALVSTTTSGNNGIYAFSKPALDSGQVYNLVASYTGYGNDTALTVLFKNNSILPAIGLPAGK